MRSDLRNRDSLISCALLDRDLRFLTAMWIMAYIGKSCDMLTASSLHLSSASVWVDNVIVASGLNLTSLRYTHG